MQSAKCNVQRVMICVFLMLFSFSCGIEKEKSDYDEVLGAYLKRPAQDQLPQMYYKISSGDILEIITWKEPDFSKEVLVRGDGKVTFPLLGDIEVGGKTPTQVRNEITAKLDAYVVNPVVSVSLKNPQSQKFYILGEISKTGEYPLTKDLTILQAIAMASGFTEWASRKEIIVIRHEMGTQRVIPINYKAIVEDKDFTQNIPVKANDTIIVP
ncbi:MAG: polysaccharide export protein [Desulfobacteraceae bacterium]|nr:polysaccharide export protein [Desulfobacteraceae bacterium]